MKWETAPKNDRLRRFCVLDTEDPGRGKEVMAENIRQEKNANLMAAAPELLQKLKECREELQAWKNDQGSYGTAGYDERFKEIDELILKAGGEI